MAKKRTTFHVKTLKTFLPVFLLASLLPVLLWSVVTGTPFTLLTRAEGERSIRIWLEPTTLITQAQKPAQFTVYAELDTAKDLLPSLAISFPDRDDVTITPAVVSYPHPFAGKIVVGTISVQTGIRGPTDVSFDTDSLDTHGIHIPAVTFGKATLVVK